jgi:hypothetical protein
MPAFSWGADYGKEMGKIFDAELLLKIIREQKEQPAAPTGLLTEDRVTLNELITSAQYLYVHFYWEKRLATKEILLHKSSLN